ncbi:Uncharacterized membrane protein [Sporobacter termitidis DSM 10068]|uniref:Uncharacterized membrane protein n=1 Tax=Sporobacter termitidis DSM 10068 TaxID=1123282 RepID=A0A1M5YG05_9FIRM|nr:QueT transporter family protein [Sporobacter termitidis]SHI10839.1 Uncharacterized membrane protein [Sporobacter termitidis DSM 10068]
MTIRKIAFAGVIAAVYAVLTMVLAPISYGPIQFRLSEVLCILPFFFPFSAWGLFIGCVVANLLSAYGLLDIVFGSLATLLAALCTMYIGRLSKEHAAVKALACLPPVVINGLVIGALIAYETTAAPGAFWPAFIASGLQVGFGELVILYVLGLPALILLPRSSFFRTLTALYAQNR